MFLREEYPPFSFDDDREPIPGDDPSDRASTSAPSSTDRNRLTVFFRCLIGHPAAPSCWASSGIARRRSLLLIAAFAVLFTGRWPEGLRDFVLGYLRWTVAALGLRPARSPTSTRRSPSTDRLSSTRSTRSPTSSTSSRRSGRTSREPDRPPEPAGGELHAQQPLDEAEVAAVRRRRRVRAAPPRRRGGAPPPPVVVPSASSIDALTRQARQNSPLTARYPRSGITISCTAQVLPSGSAK